MYKYNPFTSNFDYFEDTTPLWRKDWASSASGNWDLWSYDLKANTLAVRDPYDTYDMKIVWQSNIFSFINEFFLESNISIWQVLFMKEPYSVSWQIRFTSGWFEFMDDSASVNMPIYAGNAKISGIVDTYSTTVMDFSIGWILANTDMEFPSNVTWPILHAYDDGSCRYRIVVDSYWNLSTQSV